jgi:hypothetical protein
VKGSYSRLSAFVKEHGHMIALASTFLGGVFLFNKTITDLKIGMERLEKEIKVAVEQVEKETKVAVEQTKVAVERVEKETKVAVEQTKVAVERVDRDNVERFLTFGWHADYAQLQDKRAKLNTTLKLSK